LFAPDLNFAAPGLSYQTVTRPHRQRQFCSGKKKLAKFGTLKASQRDGSSRRSRKTKSFPLDRSIYWRGGPNRILRPDAPKRNAPAGKLKETVRPSGAGVIFGESSDDAPVVSGERFEGRFEWTTQSAYSLPY